MKPYFTSHFVACKALKSTVFGILFLMSFSVFSQNPTVINDSLVVNQRLYAKEKLIVDKEAKFKQDVVINGDLRIKSDLRIDSTLRVDGVARFNDNVKLTNVSLTTINDTAIKILVLMPNGIIKKTNLYGLSAIPDTLPIYCPSGDVPNPYWSSGLNKIYVACPPVNVGISTANPIFKLHVEGNTYAHKFICGNTTGTLTALINGFAKNDFDNLINLGVKIGASTEVVRFSVTNKGATTIANGGGQTSLTVRNGTGHAAVMFANDGTKIFQMENNGLLRTREIRIDATNWADYVFDETYNLPKLKEVAKYIDTHHRLPGIPSSSEIKKNGINVGEIQTLQMQKIEELTLYLIDMDKKMNSMQGEIDALKKENEGLKKSVKK